MDTRGLVLVTVCAAWLLSSGRASADDGQEAKFFQVLDQYKIGYVSRQEATGAAESACQALDRGASYGQLQTALLNAPGQAGPGSWTLRDADQFMFAALGAYCPKYVGLVPQASLAPR